MPPDSLPRQNSTLTEWVVVVVICPFILVLAAMWVIALLGGFSATDYEKACARDQGVAQVEGSVWDPPFMAVCKDGRVVDLKDVD